MELTRRNFVKTAGAAASAVALAGVASTALAAEGPAPAGAAPATSAVGDAAEQTDWHIAPEEVTEFAQEIECDAVVCGHGFAGITACRELAE